MTAEERRAMEADAQASRDGLPEKGRKPVGVVLRRVNLGIKTDAQYSPYYPSHRFIIYSDYGHPTHLATDTFRTRPEADAHLKAKPGGLT